MTINQPSSSVTPSVQLRAAGQSIWLDNITRRLLDSGTLASYISQIVITGLTSNPSIFDKAIRTSQDYDAGIRSRSAKGMAPEAIFFELALEDLTRAADLFAPVHSATKGVDGWVSLEVSPLLARDTKATVEAAKSLHSRAKCNNLFIKIPGTAEGLAAIEQAIFAGVPINVTLLFSTDHYLAAAEAWMRGLERRLSAGQSVDIDSVASVFVSRWDVAVKDQVPSSLKNQLGIAVAQKTYDASIQLFQSERWQRLQKAGARPQRLLWASTGTKDPQARDTLYIEALAAPNTVNTIPEETLLAFADHGKITSTLQPGGGDTAMLGRFAQAGVDIVALASRLQQEGVDAFTRSWQELITCIETKSK